MLWDEGQGATYEFIISVVRLVIWLPRFLVDDYCQHSFQLGGLWLSVYHVDPASKRSWRRVMLL